MLGRSHYCARLFVCCLIFKVFSFSADSCSRIFLYHDNDLFGSQFLFVKSLLSELGIFFSLWNLCCVSLVSFDVNALEVYDELDNLSLEGFFHISSFHLCRQLNELIHIDNVCISYILRSCLIKPMLDAWYIDIYHLC